MKQYLFLATAIATASLFTGCSNNEYVGDQPEAFNGTDGAIAFSMGKANTTRAGEGIGQLQTNGFYVYGTKTKDDHINEVFKNYKVTYASANTNKTSDYFNGWEYVGNSVTEYTPIPNIGLGNAQTIKYWDYSASKYQFYAFSAGATDLSSKNIKVEKMVSGENAYTVDIKADADIEKLYFADYVEINKPSTPPITADPTAENTYGGYVKFIFRNLAAKVRVGFYETVPGYKIRINNMYADRVEDKNKFFAVCPNTKAKQNSQITVKYKGGTGKDKDYAVVSGKNDQGGHPLNAANELTLGGGVFNTDLATTSSSPTWDNGGNYTFFWPQEASNPLKIKVDYTLTSTDNSGEKIEVKGATATVPKEYVQWAANTAYTYIFKISDNTNGSTGEGGPEGLYPITFDAVVQDYANEGFITTVSTPSVTASQNGVTFVSPDNGIMFETKKQITLKVMNGDDNVTSSATITGGYITEDYDYNKTPEQNCTNMSTKNSTLDAQENAGYWVLKVEQNSAITYVIIRVGDAEKGPETPVNP